MVIFYDIASRFLGLFEANVGNVVGPGKGVKFPPLPARLWNLIKFGQTGLNIHLFG